MLILPRYHIAVCPCPTTGVRADVHGAPITHWLEGVNSVSPHIEQCHRHRVGGRRILAKPNNSQPIQKGTATGYHATIATPHSPFGYPVAPPQRISPKGLIAGPTGDRRKTFPISATLSCSSFHETAGGVLGFP